MVLAVVLGAVALFQAFGPLVQASPEPITGPTTVQIEEGGSYAIYSVGRVGAVGDSGCAVTGPNGEVGLQAAFGNQTLTTGGQTYSLRQTFDVEPGTYTVSCAESNARYAVGPEVNVFRTVGLGFIGIFGGITMFIVGVVLLIVGLVVRSRSKSGGSPPGYPGQPPPGPYGQPYPVPNQPHPGNYQGPVGW